MFQRKEQDRIPETDLNEMEISDHLLEKPRSHPSAFRRPFPMPQFHNAASGELNV